MCGNKAATASKTAACGLPYQVTLPPSCSKRAATAPGALISPPARGELKSGLVQIAGLCCSTAHRSSASKCSGSVASGRAHDQQRVKILPGVHHGYQFAVCGPVARIAGARFYRRDAHRLAVFAQLPPCDFSRRHHLVNQLVGKAHRTDASAVFGRALARIGQHRDRLVAVQQLQRLQRLGVGRLALVQNSPLVDHRDVEVGKNLLHTDNAAGQGSRTMRGVSQPSARIR